MWRKKKLTPGRPHADIEALTRSRLVIVNAYEVERRRIERDLHDGTQQTLVAASMCVGEALDMRRVQRDAELASLLRTAQSYLERSLTSLRHTVHGIHPQILTDLGLIAAIEDLVANDDLVTLRAPQELPELPEGVLATAYFFVSEALTNARKYAPHSTVSILVTATQELRVSVMDTGPGGAWCAPGGGLEGMGERLAAIGGQLELTSPPGGPTRLVASIPMLLFTGQPSVAIPKEETTHARRTR